MARREPIATNCARARTNCARARLMELSAAAKQRGAPSL